jgi:hypothetical protein
MADRSSFTLGAFGRAIAQSDAGEAFGGSAAGNGAGLTKTSKLGRVIN